MLGLMWTMAYWLVDQLTPGGAFSFNTNAGTQSMNGFTGFYFSFITLSTVGYGDITPVSRIARWLAAMEAMTGLLYVTVLIARLVSLYSAPKSNDSVKTRIRGNESGLPQTLTRAAASVQLVLVQF